MTTEPRNQMNRLRAARACLNGTTSEKDRRIGELMAFMELVEGRKISRSEAEAMLSATR